VGYDEEAMAQAAAEMERDRDEYEEYPDEYDE
jgi:hypothetical protein